MTLDTPPDHLDAIHTFYSERLKSARKRKTFYV